MSRPTRPATVFTSVVVFVLSVGLLLALYALDQSQDLRNRASIGYGDSREACITEDCRTTIAESDDPSLFISAESRYAVRMNPEIWSQQDLPRYASDQDREPAFFAMRTPLDFATAYLASYDYPAEFLANDYSFSGDSSEFLTYLEKSIRPTFSVRAGITGRYLGGEEIQIGDTPVLRLMYEEVMGETSVPYDEYIFLGERIYLEVELRYTLTPAAENTARAFLDGVQLGASSVLGAETQLSPQERLVEIVKPSVVQVYRFDCKDLRVRGAYLFLQPTYEFCGGGMGTGFLIGDEGYVATNGHVVHSYPEQDVLYGLISGNQQMVTFYVNLLQEWAWGSLGIMLVGNDAVDFAREVSENPTAMHSVIEMIYDLFDEGVILVEPVSSVVWVNAGTSHPEPTSDQMSRFSLNTFFKPSPALFTAEVHAMNFGNFASRSIILEEGQYTGSDVAILKIENPSGLTFPALPVAPSSEVREGQSITILGYPGVSDERGSMLFDSQRSGKSVTITSGLISSIKRDGAGSLLLQTDASISQGNSGGPAFNQDGQVIGIVTYGLNADGGHYNLLRDTQDLFAIGQEKNLTIASQPRVVFSAWEQGLDYYWQSRFTRSLEQLQLVQAEYPIHPTVGGVVLAAEDSIEAGLDIDYIFGIEKVVFYTILGILVTGVVLGTIVLLMTLGRKRKLSPGVTVSATPVSPVAPTPKQSQPDQPVPPTPESQPTQL